MSAKKAWMVCGMDSQPLADKDYNPAEYKSERAALAAAKLHVNQSDDSEAWVYVLTHVVSRPDGAVVEEIK